MKCVRSCFVCWFGVAFSLAMPLGAQTEKISPVVTAGRLADIYAETGGETLLDFSTLAEDANPETEIDFSDMAPYHGLSEAEKPFMKMDLAIKNWEIFIPPASRWLAFQYPSYLAVANVKQNSVVFAGEKVLGIRLFFPPGRRSSYSVLAPFPIPFYSGESGNQFLNKGVIKNVGAIKEVEFETYGQYYDVDVSIVLEDMKGRDFEIPLGDLNFIGWRRMVWQNPAYAEASAYNIANSQRDNPVFPPAYRFKKLVFRHGAYDKTTDVVAYVKSIKVIYDKAWDNGSIEVDNESFWRSYYNSLDRSGFPSYKIYILERFLNKRRENILKSKESFIKADPVVARE